MTRDTFKAKGEPPVTQEIQGLGILSRYVYLHIEPTDDMPNGITIHVKLDDEGVVVDAWDEPADAVDGAIATTCKTYNDMGVGVVAVETLEELRDKASKWDEYIKSVIKQTGGQDE